jgi:hypothetical protein
MRESSATVEVPLRTGALNPDFAGQTSAQNVTQTPGIARAHNGAPQGVQIHGHQKNDSF